MVPETIVGSDGTVPSRCIDASLEYRYGHTCVSVGNAFFQFGGWNGQQAVNDVVVLELNDST